MKENTTKVLPTSELSKTIVGEIHERARQEKLTIGLDLGDRESNFCMVNQADEVLVRGTLSTTKAGLNKLFEKMPPARVAMEVGTHSPWVSRQLEGHGLEVVVANARNVAWISKSQKKDDRLDAEKLARMARAGMNWLSPIRHRSEQAQRDLMVMRARAEVVEARTQLINSVRGLVKSVGERLASCDSTQVGTSMLAKLNPVTAAAVKPMMEAIEGLSEQIVEYDKLLEQMTRKYPETEPLMAVHGVGIQVALAFVLTIEDPKRFGKSREVGAYLGMVPRRKQSGEQDPELGINKEGDNHLRWLLVQSAHCILRKDAADSDLRRWGLEKLGEPEKGGQGKDKGGKSGKNRRTKGKKRVLVAVARRLAVLLHHLWVS